MDAKSLLKEVAKVRRGNSPQAIVSLIQSCNEFAEAAGLAERVEPYGDGMRIVEPPKAEPVQESTEANETPDNTETGS